MLEDIHHGRILILDFGSQTTQLIARRIRESHVYSEIHPYDMSETAIRAFNPKGIILSGGPESLTRETAPRPSRVIYELGCPILGICYGLQLLADQLGGAVQSIQHRREFGLAKLTLCTESELWRFLFSPSSKGSHPLTVWMSHGDQISELPPGFQVIAGTQNAPYAAIAEPSRHYYGLQFHPEVTHTEHGTDIIRHFVQTICQCQALWTPQHIIQMMKQDIRHKVGKEGVILGLSGGVDSAVTAALLHAALDQNKHLQLTCIFVDNGLLRAEEAEEVMERLAREHPIRIVRVNAHKRFLSALKGVVEPEIKRKIIGKIFYDVFEEEAAKHKDVQWLAQGTIYPDVIESASAKTKKAHVIKTHHNVGGLPKTIRLKLLEPLRELFKDEVRKIGLELGLPKSLVYRHPFPGPGLAVRILGEIDEEACKRLRKADAIFIEELKKANLYDTVSQAFAVLLPVKSVAVMGDARVYEPVLALRAVTTSDFMTAAFAKLPYAFLEHVANRITNEVEGISRVVYDISSKPPATIEWE
ncbi:MAG: glutamine-hydrolyzing GMP synthase [Gammaproteobacteria bacterium]|nr:glutamine-hydrolyzing GMP synthase [Gammaproteobacteria bacterium]